ncbi:hypothetical protein M408DRAFT_331786 [Serendipita vermifera MAFF 305830]|uniref:PLC-like phosphodiesterase n=1 Tax=Serendipita vermifera MAFF 305830 TaxID=933852 RepID=A0A0C3AWQ5_SERVB|nr:hypothetical protein M408DRAFT_331786 [Serendipita vermifera MAFF 305830]
MIGQFLILNALVTFVAALPAIIPRASTCNGRAELCGRSYGNTTFLMSHDSYAISNNPVILSRNQAVDLTAQMNLGVRALQAQSHMKDGALHFCHTSCDLFDGGLVVNYLKTVKSFMDSHPNDVFTFLFTNPENASPKNVWAPLFEQAGLASLAYVPPHLPMKASEWPTLGQMIQSGKRLVVFMDYNSNTAEVPYILPEFDHIWEPPFNSIDSSFPCRVDRISGPLSSQDHMFMINHNLDVKVFPFRQAKREANPGFWDSITSAIGGAIEDTKNTIENGINQGKDTLSEVLIPDLIHLPITNGVPSILADSNGCAPFSGGKATSFVMLDFVDVGQGMKAVDILNGFR